nr:aminoacyl-tRNA synthetase, class 1a, anticodon-binding [Tanacetum cinerariifolium]
MAALRYRDEHNKVGYLLKPTGSDDYHQIIDFLRTSHIRYALTHNPIIFDSLVIQFWSMATLRSPKLADDGGIDDLPIAEIYSGMDSLGTKSGSWDQFGSPLAVALICLSNGRQFNWSSYIFKGMVSYIRNAKKFLMRNFDGHHMALLAAMLSQDQEGVGAEVAAQSIPQHLHAPDQPQDHLSTPPRQQTSDPNALVFEHGQSSYPKNIASFLRTHETDDDPFTNVEDEPLGGSFYMSPPRSTQAPFAGQTLGGAEDLITLTALSFVVSTLVQKVNSLETKLNDHKKLFKDVVGKLVKKVKAIKVKLRTMKRKLVVSDSDQEVRGKKDVDLDALLALANAAVTVDSNIPLGGASNNPAASISVPADVPTTANVPTGSTSVPADVPTSVAPAGVSNKGKTPMVEEDITVKERTFKQMKDDKLGEQAAKRLHDEEQAQVEANASLSKILMDDDVSEDNFSARMAALIKRKKQALAEKLAKERKDRPMIVFSPKSSGTRRKSLGRKRLPKPKSKLQELDLGADDQTFIKVIPTPLGDISALYRIDRSTAHFITLRQILHMVDRQDLVTLYGLVVKYYENHPVVSAGLILWGDLQVLFDSYEGDVPYPLSVKLMERMLKHKLAIDKDGVANDMTTTEQLIQFIKNQLAAA